MPEHFKLTDKMDTLYPWEPTSYKIDTVEGLMPYGKWIVREAERIERNPARRVVVQHRVNQRYNWNECRLLVNSYEHINVPKPGEDGGASAHEAKRSG